MNPERTKNRSLPDHVFHPQEDGVLVDNWMATGSHSVEYFGIPPTARVIMMEGVSIFDLSDDGISQIQCYFDRSAVREQLGLSFPEVVGHVPRLFNGVMSPAFNRG